MIRTCEDLRVYLGVSQCILVPRVESQVSQCQVRGTVAVEVRCVLARACYCSTVLASYMRDMRTEEGGKKRRRGGRRGERRGQGYQPIHDGGGLPTLTKQK